MRKTLVLLCLALACLSQTQAAVYRRGDKISENFKQLDLAPEEIDPDVAPLSHHQEQQQLLESVDETTDEILNVNENEILDEAGDNEIIDESANEIPQSVATVAPVVVTTVAPVAVAAPAEPAAAAAAATPVKGEPELTGLAKYCKCNENHCDCCRNFNLPLIPVKGPGCARMTYLGNEKMSISLKYGDLTLASRTVSSKRARPICVGLPGGYSQFCGRVYGLSKANENFKACLGFELRADDEVEAALRVSCFKFGPEGLRVAEAEPLPVETNKEEDDDDDDIFGFGAGDDEEEEDDYNEDDEEEEEEADDDADTDADSDAEYADDDAEEEAPADADYGGFSLAGLLDELDDDEDEETKPSSTPVLTPAAASTRTAVDSVQSKDDKGTAAATAPAAEAAETVAPVVAAVTDLATTAPESMPDTTAKTKKSKKARKNKKKKAADTEGDFAYDLLNGLLDFFN